MPQPNTGTEEPYTPGTPGSNIWLHILNSSKRLAPRALPSCRSRPAGTWPGRAPEARARWPSPRPTATKQQREKGDEARAGGRVKAEKSALRGGWRRCECGKECKVRTYKLCTPVIDVLCTLRASWDIWFAIQGDTGPRQTYRGRRSLQVCTCILHDCSSIFRHHQRDG